MGRIEPCKKAIFFLVFFERRIKCACISDHSYLFSVFRSVLIGRHGRWDILGINYRLIGIYVPTLGRYLCIDYIAGTIIGTGTSCKLQVV